MRQGPCDGGQAERIRFALCSRTLSFESPPNWWTPVGGSAEISSNFTPLPQRQSARIGKLSISRYLTVVRGKLRDEGRAVR